MESKTKEQLQQQQQQQQNFSAVDFRLLIPVDVAANSGFFALLPPDFEFYIPNLTQRFLNLSIVCNKTIYILLPTSAIFPLTFNLI